MQDKKIYIVLIGIIIIFFVVAFFFLDFPSIKEKKLDLTIIVDNHATFQYYGQKWKSINSEKQELNWNQFDVYLDGQKYGNYYLWWGDDSWQAFDDKKDPVQLEGQLLAYTSNYDIEVAPLQESSITDTSYIANVLKNHNISLSSKLTSSSKISLDFDKDGVVEDFYAISNAFSLNDKPNVVFSFAFMVKNQSIYMIYEDVRQDSFLAACKPYFSGFLDVNKDKKYEIILSCGKYSMQEPLAILYHFTNNGFEVLASNE